MERLWKRVEKEGFQCVGARSLKGVFASVHKSLWLYQIVILEGKRYCLSCMGFGLNVVPSIIRAIVEATLLKDDAVWQATSAYINDVFINEDIASVTRVRQYLANFGLASKEPGRLQNSARA